MKTLWLIATLVYIALSIAAFVGEDYIATRQYMMMGLLTQVLMKQAEGESDVRKPDKTTSLLCK